MAKLNPFEKWFVNRRGEKFFRKLVFELETSSAININGNSRILELGGGNGAFSLLLYERYHPLSINLTDYDPDQVVLARNSLEKKYGSLPKSFVLEQADATRLAYKDDSFDLVIAHLILHHLGGIDDIFAGLKEISRVLVPGGTFVYVEFAHKEKIRKYLTDLGFGIPFKSGRHRESVVAVKPLEGIDGTIICSSN